MYYKDLARYRKAGGSEAHTYTVGWLDDAHSFSKGETSPGFTDRLLRLCVAPVNRARGWHRCCLCDGPYPITVDVDGVKVALGDGEINVMGEGARKYVSPNLIYHYVAMHGYSPPEEFQRAVLQTVQPTPTLPTPGLEELLRSWRALVESLKTEYSLTLDDYENDLDIRELLERLISASDEAERRRLNDTIAPLDAAFISRSVANDLIRHREGLPWLSRSPREPGPELVEQLAALKSVRKSSS